MAAMRVRLRAPEEDHDAANGTASWSTLSREQHLVFTTTSTAPRQRTLPQLDLRSPEYIEERLENLKRKPTWRAWLDQYVQDHPESDSDGDREEGDDRHVEIDHAAKPKKSKQSAGFLKTTWWSVVVVAFTPLLVVLYPCLRNKEHWPLGCTSLPGLIVRAFSTLVFIAFSAALIYWTICRELPELNRNAYTNLQVRLRDMLRTSETCQASIFQYDLALFQELCMPIVIDGALLLLNVVLLFQSHQKWARYALVFMAGAFFVDAPTKLYQATFPSPDIVSIDPSYALLDEELVVALEGKNLKPGGSVAWVAYWGCASTSSVDTCEKQFPASFDVGVARATFSSIDHFIPCYRDPPNPLKAQEYKCFDHIRLRVKDKQSIPGWSKAGRQRNAGSLNGDDDASNVPPVSTEHTKQRIAEQQQRQVKGQARQKMQKKKRVSTMSVDSDGEVAQE